MSDTFFIISSLLLLNVLLNELSEKSERIDLDDYINTKRFDKVTITKPNNLVINDTYIYIEYFGFIFDKTLNKYVEQTTKYKHYVESYDLFFNYFSDSIDIYCKLNDNNTFGNILFYFDGVLVKNILVNYTDEKIGNEIFVKRFLCRPFFHFHIEDGSLEKYINANIRNEGINLSKLNSIIVVCENVILDRINHIYYNTYRYPSMLNVFV